MMKNLMVTALLLVGMASFAQTTGIESRKQRSEQISPEKRTEMQVKKMTEELGLNAKQQVEVAAILAENSAKRETMIANRRANKEKATAMSAEAKAEKKAQMKAHYDATNERMKKILTADQYSKWEQIKAEKKDRMKERRATKTTKTVKTHEIKK